MHAVEYIKKQVGVVPIENIRSYLSLQSADFLVPLLKKMDQMSYNAVQRGFEYMPKFNIRTKAQLMAFLKSQPTAKGLSVRDLKDGWADCLDSIEELEQSGDLIVLRTKKENSPRMMWANMGGPIGMVDGEFRSMWSQIKVPDGRGWPQAYICGSCHYQEQQGQREWFKETKEAPSKQDHKHTSGWCPQGLRQIVGPYLNIQGRAVK
jgi:transcription initiation factor TFIIE subunit beta